MANHKFNVNVGLHTSSVPVTGVEADLWYDNAVGNVRAQVGAETRSVSVGPHGSHPSIYTMTNGWYPMQPGGGAHSAVAVTNNRAYAYPIWPGRKCTLAGVACRISAAGAVGNLRTMLYAPDTSTGLPGSLITDYGTVTAVTGGAATISGWTISTALEALPYWFVFNPQTTTPPSMSRYSTFNQMIPWNIATPTMGTADFANCVYSDTGFTGAAPATFGAIAQIDSGPFFWMKFT